MFIISLTLLTIIALKETELSVDVNSKLGWVCVYIFVIQLVGMVTIYFRTLKRSEKVLP